MPVVTPRLTLRLWISHAMAGWWRMLRLPSFLLPSTTEASPRLPHLLPSTHEQAHKHIWTQAAKANTSVCLSWSPRHKSLFQAKPRAEASPIAAKSLRSWPLHISQSGDGCSVWLPLQVHPLDTQSPTFSRAAVRSNLTIYPTGRESSRVPPTDISRPQ